MLGKRVLILENLVSLVNEGEFRFGVVKSVELSPFIVVHPKGYDKVIMFNTRHCFCCDDNTPLPSEVIAMSRNLVLSNCPYDFRHITRKLAVISKYSNENDEVLSKGINGMYLFDEDFIRDYEAFTTQSKSISNLGFDASSQTVLLLYALSNGSKGLFEWALHNQHDYGTDMYTLEYILNWNDVYGYLAKFLEKKSITSYQLRNAEQDDALMCELNSIRDKKRAKDISNTFNTTQKKILKSSENPNLVRLLCKFSNLGTTTRINFIKKVSSINDEDELIKQLVYITGDHFSWSRSDLMDYLSNVRDMDAEVVYDKNGVVMLKVNTYDTIKRIAKKTAWCISKGQSYWGDYMSRGHSTAKQYVMFDFNEREGSSNSIIGFTVVYGDSIIASHDFKNKDVLNIGELDPYMLKPMRDNAPILYDTVMKSSVYGILKKRGIPMSVFEYGNEFYDSWNKEEFIGKLIEYGIKPKNITTIKDSNDRLVLLINDKCSCCIPQLKKAVDDVSSPVDYEDIYEKVMVFVDFAKSPNNKDSLLFAKIRDNGRYDESCYSIIDSYGEHRAGSMFNMLLIDYGIPFDVISRHDDMVSSFNDSIRSFDFDTASKIANGNKEIIVKGILKSRNAAKDICHTLTMNHTTRLLELVYDNGLTIEDILGKAGLISITSMIINTFVCEILSTKLELIWGASEHNFDDMDKLLDKVSKEDRPDINFVKLLHTYLFIKMFAQHEYGKVDDKTALKLMCCIIRYILGSNISSMIAHSLVKGIFDCLRISSRAYNGIKASSAYQDTYENMKANIEEFMDLTPIQEVKDVCKKITSLSFFNY